MLGCGSDCIPVFRSPRRHHKLRGRGGDGEFRCCRAPKSTIDAIEQRHAHRNVQDKANGRLHRPSVSRWRYQRGRHEQLGGCLYTRCGSCSLLAKRGAAVLSEFPEFCEQFGLIANVEREPLQIPCSREQQYLHAPCAVRISSFPCLSKSCK